MSRAPRLVVPVFAIALVTSAVHAPPGPPPPNLVYVDSSQGLDQPGLEGGDTELEMGDVDGDGDPDLVSVGDHGNPRINTDEEGIMVWFGDGAGNWTLQQGGDLGYGGVALGDVNDDGEMDVAYGIHHDYSPTDLGDQLLEVALGDGTGLNWTPWDDGLAEDGQSWGMFSTDLGDVDADGDLDVGSIGFGASDGLHVYLNQGDGTWKRSFGFLGGNSSHVFAFGDIDGDGHLDAATAKQEGTVWLGDGEGFLIGAEGNLPPLPAYGVREGPSLGDVDGDGRDDLAYCDDSSNARVWLWRGDDTWDDVSTGVPATGTCQHTQLHDMDGDGLVDLVTFGDATAHVFGGDGTGASWTELSTFVTPEDVGNSKAFRVGGDVDHNGLPDMALVDDKRINLFNTQNVLHVYREASVPSELSVRVVRPGPNRRLLAGAVTFVEWASAVPSGTATTVEIELSTSGPEGPWTPVASALPNNGCHQWRLPDTITGDGRLRVTVSAPGDQQVSAVSASAFAIARRPDPVRLSFSSRDELSLEDELARERLNLYRSDWQRFLDTGGYTQDPATEPHAERFCDLETTTVTDTFEPSAGSLVFYLATGYRLMEDGQEPGVAVPMAEGALGQNAAAAMRPNAAPCPR